jgi:signal transduction histidine kinase
MSGYFSELHNRKLPLIIWFLCLLASLFPGSTRAQEFGLTGMHTARSSSDSLRVLLKHNVQRIRKEKIWENDSLTNFLFRTLNISKQLDEHSATSELLFRLGMLSKNKGAYEQAKNYYLEAIPYAFRGRAFKEGLPRIYANLADVYVSFGNYPLAATYFYAALNMVPQQASRSELLIVLHSGIAGLHMRYGQYGRSIRHVRYALSLARKTNDSRLTKILGNAANAYSLLNRKEEAMALQQEGLSIARRNGDLEAEQGLLISIGELHLRYDNPQEALQCFLQAIRISKSIDLPNSHMNAYLQYITGRTYNLLKQYSAGFSMLEKSLRMSEQTMLKDYVHLLHAALSANYAARGDYRSAWIHEKLHSSLKDSLMNKERAAVVQGLEFKYQSIRKDMSLTQKELVISRQQQALNTRNAVTGIAIGCMVMVSLLSFAFYRSIRNKHQLQAEKLRTFEQEKDLLKKQEAISVMQALIEGEERERRRISQELHDGIGGRLAALQMYCSHEEVATGLGDRHLKRITEMLEDTAEEIRNTAHNLMPDILSRYSFSDALEMYCRQISNSGPLEISLQVHASPDVLSAATKLSLYRIVQELIQNMLKHAGATQATIQVNREGNVFTIIAEDNGGGFLPDPTTGHGGMGLVNIRNRIKSLNGQFLIESASGQGTIVQIELPVES